MNYLIAQVMYTVFSSELTAHSVYTVCSVYTLNIMNISCVKFITTGVQYSKNNL